MSDGSGQSRGRLPSASAPAGGLLLRRPGMRAKPGRPAPTAWPSPSPQAGHCRCGGGESGARFRRLVEPTRTSVGPGCSFRSLVRRETATRFHRGPPAEGEPAFLWGAGVSTRPRWFAKIPPRLGGNLLATATSADPKPRRPNTDDEHPPSASPRVACPLNAGSAAAGGPRSLPSSAPNC